MDVSENNWQERVVVISKPEQSGKTFIMIDNIKNNLNEEISDSKKRTLNIIFCDNSLLLTQQTGNRITNELQLINTGDGETLYLMLSSQSKCNKVENAIGRIIMYPELSNILCCTNNTRMSDIKNLVLALNSIQQNNITFRIWLDEADKYCNYIRDVFKPCVSNNTNVYLYLMTATTSSEFFKPEILGNEIWFYPIEDPTHESYHGWTDNNVRIYEDKSNFIDFVNNRLQECKKDNLIKPGDIWFIPALSRKQTHMNVAELCNQYNMAVIITNGDGISIKLPTSEVIGPISKNRSLDDILKDIYIKYNLNRYPLAVTGHVCIGRGVTLWKNEFRPNFAIINEKLSSESRELSQIAGRMKGSFKQWPNFVPPTIFTTRKFHDNAVKWEKRACDLARIAYDKERENLKPTITKFEYDKVAGQDYVPIFKEISLDEAKKEGATMRGRKKDSNGNYLAAKDLLHLDGVKWPNDKPIEEATLENNPDLQYVKNRGWGLVNGKLGSKRFVPLNNGKWCMYWKEKKK